jgi:hypothetical protein
MSSLQQITDSWGNWLAKQYGTSCDFTASTDYGAQGALAQYMEYQCSATPQSISYENEPKPPPLSADIADKITYNNGSSVAQTEILERSYTSTDEFTWSITESLSIGVQVTVGASIPDFLQIQDQYSVTLSLSSTQGQTKTNSRTWTVNTTLTIPPESSLNCEVLIKSQPHNVNFTATVNLLGFVAIWFKDQVALGAPGDLHWLWFVPITSVFSDFASHNLGDISGYRIVGNGVLASSTGVFTSKEGLEITVSTSPSPLPTAVPNVALRAQTDKRLYPEAVAGM